METKQFMAVWFMLFAVTLVSIAQLITLVAIATRAFRYMDFIILTLGGI